MAAMDTLPAIIPSSAMLGGLRSLVVVIDSPVWHTTSTKDSLISHAQQHNVATIARLSSPAQLEDELPPTSAVLLPDGFWHSRISRVAHIHLCVPLLTSVAQTRPSRC